MDRRQGQVRRRTRLVGTTALAALVLSGCVGRLETTPYRERTPTLGGALRGVTYSLPKLQYDVKLTRYLSECPGEIIEGKPTALKFSVQVEATPRYVPGEAYTVNYDRLDGFLRTSSFELKTWPNGTLKSIGAGAEDKTAEVIKDSVKTVLSLASAATSLGLLAGPVSQPTRGTNVVRCTQQAADMVADARDLRKKLKDGAEKLAKYQKDAERIQARAAIKLANRDDRLALIKLHQEMDEEEARVAKAKEELAKLIEKLGVSLEYVWDSDLEGDAIQQRDLSLTGEDNNKLAALLEIGPIPPPTTEEERQQEAKRKKVMTLCYDPSPDVVNCVNQQLNMRSEVALQSPLPACKAGEDKLECIRDADTDHPRYRAARDRIPDSGLFVREPVQARLLFCRAVRIPEGERCTRDKDEGKIAEAFFPQLGQLRYLPLRVGTFQAREMALSMTEDGRVESFTYKSTKAAGQGLAGAASDGASQLAAALEARETERRDDVAQARAEEIASIQQEISRLTKQAELKKLQTPDPLQGTRDETAAIEADIALLKAKLARLQAEAALAQTQS